MSQRCQRAEFRASSPPWQNAQGLRSSNAANFSWCEAIGYNFSVCVEKNLSRGVLTSVVSEPELTIDALP